MEALAGRGKTVIRPSRARYGAFLPHRFFVRLFLLNGYALPA